MSNDNVFNDIPSVNIIPESFPGVGKDFNSTFGNSFRELKVGEGETAFRVNHEGMWLGAEEFSDADFRVDMSGNATLNSLVLSLDLDDIPDGETYVRIPVTSVSAGKIIVAGLDSTVEARLFSSSSRADAIEAWSHSSDVTLIDGGDIYTGSITAAKIATNTITASSGCIYSLSATKITAGTLNCSLITVSNLSASSITTGYLTATRISGGTLNCSLMTVTNINADSIESGSIDASDITITNINATNITAGTLTGRTVKSSSGTEYVQLNNGNTLDFYLSSSLKGQFKATSAGAGGIRCENGDFVINNNRSLLLQSTTADYFKIANNASSQAIIALPYTNQFFIKNSAETVNLFTVSSTQVYSAVQTNVEAYLTCNDFWSDTNINCGGTKYFNIQHPLKDNHRLVYAATESNGVYLDIHGETEIINGKAIVEFPDYHRAVTSGNPTVIITNNGWYGQAIVTDVDNNGFTIEAEEATNGSKVYWFARSTRIGYEEFNPEQKDKDNIALNIIKQRKANHEKIE